jgi:16S rRNA C1402 (ribose-2'-O) methylase RsmI
MGADDSIAYVSDAGTPGISDPGYRLVREAIQQGIKVVPIPGASALTTFLCTAGLPTDSFIFRGFLPHKKGRQTVLQECKKSDRTSVFCESVHRFPKLLKELSEILDNSRVIVVGRELTKMHEEFFRGNLAEAGTHFSAENTKGEFVVAISPRGFSFSAEIVGTGRDLSAQLSESREKIDRLDAELLKLLGERLKISRKIAQIKQKQDLPKYIPEREQELIANLQNLNDSKLRDGDIERIWGLILEISRGKV